MKPSFAQPKNISEDQTSNPKKKFLNQANQQALFDRISNTARKVILGPICDAESMILWDGLNQ